LTLTTAETLSGTFDNGSLREALAWGFVFVLPLVVRRRFPVAVWFTILALLVLEATMTGAAEGVGAFFGLLVGVYTVAAYRPRRIAVSCLVVLVPVVVYMSWRSTGNPLDDLGFIVVLVGGFFVAGRVVWSRNELVQQLAEQSVELRQSRDAEARALAAEQRERIARDVHDVVAHSVSLMVVQAEAGEAQLPAGSASGANLAAIQRVGRATLAELRGLLAALGEDVPPGTRTPLREPMPRLRDADVLVDELVGAGLSVDLQMNGDVTSLPAGVDLAVYRILQEALTNALRHGGDTVRARVDATREAVVVEVVDGGRGGHASTVNGSGRGLIGMRERARLYGGDVEAGPTADGFRVCARLPVPAAAMARP
ncbi:MAG: sensor histidine kinase, partial [Nocardioidaceae bacterium]